MKFLHQQLRLDKGQKVKVEFDTPTRILLMDENNFIKYKRGRTYTYFGGSFEDSPVAFEIPFKGVWHPVIEKGTYKNPIEVKGTITILSDMEDVEVVNKNHNYKPQETENPAAEEEKIEENEEITEQEEKE